MTLTRTLMIGTALALMTSGAGAADLLTQGVDPIYQSSLFNFEGFYVGGSLGFGSLPVSSRVGTVGVVVGTNFALAEGILAGVEFQGDAVWNSSGFTGLDGLFLGKLGGYLTDETLIYGTGGLGWVDDESSYALGLGIEQALTDSISVRGEGMVTGGLGGGFDGGQLKASVLWHMN